jgi:hypothetical protein
MTLPEKHEIDIAGYGHPRDGESWCSCGWESLHDLMGNNAIHHYLTENQPRWQALEEFYEQHKEKT